MNIGQKENKEQTPSSIMSLLKKPIELLLRKRNVNHLV